MRRRDLFLLSAGAVASLVTTLSRSARADDGTTEEKFTDVREKLESFGLSPDEYVIIVDPRHQELCLLKGDLVIKKYPISTSRFGLGEKYGSLKTPRGTHRVKEKYGSAISPLGTAFKGRKRIGVAKITNEKELRVWGAITSRIIWLAGEEPGFNKGKNERGVVVDSYRRFIYIHGTASEGLIGKPASIGCIMMKNKDIAELFDMVPVDTLVEILDRPYIGPEQIIKKQPVSKKRRPVRRRRKTRGKKSAVKRRSVRKLPPRRRTRKRKSGR